MKQLWRGLLVSSSAFLTASGFIWQGAGLLSIVGLVFLIVLLERSERVPQRQFLWYCALFGYVYCGLVLRWVFAINALDLIGDTFFATLFTGLTYVLMVGALAVGFVVSGYLYRQLNISVKNKTIILLPALWIIGEYIRSVFFSVFAMGDGGSLGHYWNFGVLGFSVMHSPLKYASRIVGSLGISFLLVLIAVALYQLAHRRWRYAPLLLVPIVFSVVGWRVYQNPGHTTLHVASVGLHESVEAGYETTLREALKAESALDAMVLPEYSNYFFNTEGSRTSATLPKGVQLVIDSASARHTDKIHNMVSFYQPDGTVLSQQAKSFLIPGGEYLPYIYHIILFYSGNQNCFMNFIPHGQYMRHH